MGEGIREDRKSEREAGWEGEKGEGREGGGRGRPGWERVKWGEEDAGRKERKSFGEDMRERASVGYQEIVRKQR